MDSSSQFFLTYEYCIAKKTLRPENKSEQKQDKNKCTDTRCLGEVLRMSRINAIILFNEKLLSHSSNLETR